MCDQKNFNANEKILLGFTFLQQLMELRVVKLKFTNYNTKNVE